MISLTPSSSDCYSVKWKSQETHILEGIRSLTRDGTLLTDVTLACDGDYIKAHKLVLALCSSFFKDLFQKNRADKSNTIVILGNVSARNFRYLLRFMYEGRVDIPSRHVDGFLQAGNMLKIEGLLNRNISDSSEQIKPVTLKTRQDGGGSQSLSSSSRSLKRNKPSSVASMIKLMMASSSKKRKESNDGDQSDFSENDDSDDEGVSGEMDVEERSYIKREPSSRVVSEYEDGGDESDGIEEVIGGGEGDFVDDVTKGFQSSNLNTSSVRRPLARPGRKKRSLVWNYFIPNSKTSATTAAKCKLCKGLDIVVKINRGSTSGLISHLKSQHPGALESSNTISGPPQSNWSEDSTTRNSSIVTATKSQPSSTIPFTETLDNISGSSTNQNTAASAADFVGHEVVGNEAEGDMHEMSSFEA